MHIEKADAMRFFFVIVFLSLAYRPKDYSLSVAAAAAAAASAVTMRPHWRTDSHATTTRNDDLSTWN